jgi:pimeloyl-ACP methyl ester carboxylesterase
MTCVASRWSQAPGHWIQQEKPAETNAFILDFLRGLKE